VFTWWNLRLFTPLPAGLLMVGYWLSLRIVLLVNLLLDHRRRSTSSYGLSTYIGGSRWLTTTTLRVYYAGIVLGDGSDRRWRVLGSRGEG
jgi:hypothetical protein